MTILPSVLICVAIILLAVPAQKPHGWIALALAVVSLLVVAAGLRF